MSSWSRRSGESAGSEWFAKSSKLVNWVEAVLAAKFVEAWDAVLAVADEIQSDYIDLLRRALQPADPDVLEEHGRVVVRQKAKALASQGEAPIGHST